MSKLNDVWIVDSARIPFARSGGSYMGLSNLQLITPALKTLVARHSLQGQALGEASFGAVSKHWSDWGFARECVIESGLDPSTPAFDIQKACGTSLETIIAMANKIALGQIDSAFAGGADTNSDVPMEFPKKFSDRLIRLNQAKTLGQKLKALKGLSPKEFMPKFPEIKEKRTGLSMGESCEIMAKDWNIERSAQDQLAFDSHSNAIKAHQEGFFDDLVIQFKGVKRDENTREPNLEKLAKLKPVFDRKDGTLTAGNSTPLTDGAAAVFLCNEAYAKAHNLEPLARITFVQSAAVNYLSDEGLLMAPAYAIPKLIGQAGMKLQEFDFYEIHEAFAAQVLCTLKALEDDKFCQEKLGLEKALGSIDRSKLNVNGGSLAVGHPFGATGARIVGSLAKMLHKKGSGKGLISICTAGGMGVTAILER
jgi:acetyl-CoA C-acetyltransferase